MLKFIAIFFLASMASAQSLQTFVRVDSQTELYIDYKLAKPGQPTIVLLNGMTYSTVQWHEFVNEVERLHPDIGILRYDMRGMGQTLLKYREHFDNNLLNEQWRLPIDQQSTDLLRLLNVLNLKDPVYLVGLSYGGGVALQFLAENPDRVAKALLIAPYTQPQRGQHELIKYQMRVFRYSFPLAPISDDALYDVYLRLIVTTTYPNVEPIVLENPYKLEATFRLAQGAKKYLASTFVDRLPAHSVHLMLGGRDEYITADVFEKFWQSLPQTSRASRYIVMNGHHKLPEESARITAGWLSRILTDKGELSKGDTFINGDSLIAILTQGCRKDLE